VIAAAFGDAKIGRVKSRFIEPMLLLRTEKLPDSPDLLYEIKLDGYRAMGISS
jgi:ATP-dependent DNA ligase